MNKQLEKLFYELLNCCELNQDDLEPETRQTLDEIRALMDFEKSLGRLSFYNAAEGRDFSRETGKREKCRKDLNMQAKRLIQLGIDPDKIIEQGSYLVDTGCWV